MPKYYAYISVIMGAIFVGFGLAMPWYPPQVFLDMGIQGNYLYIIAIVLIMYGTFRISRAMKHIKRSA